MNIVRINLSITVIALLVSSAIAGQLVVTSNPNANSLAQKLVGEGVIISNVSFSGVADMAGFFNNMGGTNILIDSGIVLTNGRAKGRSPNIGLSGSSALNAHNQMGQPGDPDLSSVVSATTNDACILEFDFVPLGDSIKFDYVFSSEEYPNYACSEFNDAFAFFISGPGISGLQNIALIPGTSAPVTIKNINDQSCAVYPQYYISNLGNQYFTHNGHTKVLTALAKVRPCEVYHLKLVIADVGDADFDSGVFLKAGSLSSNVIGFTNATQVDPGGNNYLVEGCVPGSITIRRPRKDPTPLMVSLAFGGTAINGTDVQTLPTSVTIPANDSFVVLNINPIIDGIPEGIETLKIYALAGCSAGNPGDSSIIQIRDYDILDITPDSAFVCKNGSIQLTASVGYSNYQWDAEPTLNNIGIANPIASPTADSTIYICTATQGSCNAKDSVFVQLKKLKLLSKTDVNCRGASTGNIKVIPSAGWVLPLEFSLDGITWQPDSNFTNLPVGNYWVKSRDVNCIDSINVVITQAFPDLLINNINITGASCTGGADGKLIITASGGSTIFQYSVDGVNFQPGNQFNLNAGDYTATIKDNNGCTTSENITIPVINTVLVNASSDTSICEGTSYTIPATSNGDTFNWTPVSSLSNPASLSPKASPATTTIYYITATSGICTQIDSIKINIKPAPLANAGNDVSVCFGKVFELDGSGGVSFQWTPSTYFTTSPAIAKPSVKATNSITYYLNVIDAAGCASITPDPVEIKVTPSVKLFAGNDTTAAINQPIQLQVKEIGNAGVTRYNWSPGNFLDNPDVENPVAKLPYDFRYTVIGTTPDGCEGRDDILIKVYQGPDIYVPSGFTPNYDGLNDLLKATSVGIKDFRGFSVFNRWGQMIFSTKDPAKGWDGTFKGILQPTGTYVWIADAIDYKGNPINRKGVVTIIR